MCARKIVNTLGATNIAKSIREDLDFYQTPSGATSALVKSGLLDKNTTIWEPMAGNGAIVEVLKQNGYSVVCSDIVERKYKLDFVDDFFVGVRSMQMMQSNWQIVTNPPYNMVDRFLQHCLSMVPSFLAVFLPVRYLEGMKRFKDIYSKYVPSDVIVFAQRYGCYKELDKESGIVTDRGVGSAIAYMWLCFKKKEDGSYGNETKLHFAF